MKVTLFPDMKAEGWPSMDRYAESLIRQFKVQSSKFKVFCAEPPIGSARVRMFWRNNVYPRLARFHQGDANHVLDHSYARLLNYLNPVKTVVTCHDLLPLEFEEDARIRDEFLKTVQNLTQAAHVLADSQATKKDLIEKLGLVDGKITVVYLGVDKIFRPIEDPEKFEVVRRKYSLPSGKLILSGVSNSLPYKNIERTLAAFYKILTAEPAAHLVRVGSLTQKQRRIVADLQLRDHYHELHSVPDEDLNVLYNLADVFLCPSLKEGFGFPALEALACGTPIVVSKGTSLAEIAGEAGIYVDPQSVSDIAEKTLRVLRNGLAVTHPESELITQAQKFSWVETAQKLLAVYAQVFDRQNRIL